MKFSDLAALLRGSSKLTITITRQDSEVQVLMTPVPSVDEKKLAPELAQLRALLARPLIVRGALEEIDAKLAAELSALGEARAPVAAALDTGLERFRTKAEEATRKAADAKPAAKPAGGSSKASGKGGAAKPAGGGEDEPAGDGVPLITPAAAAAAAETGEKPTIELF